MADLAQGGVNGMQKATGVAAGGLSIASLAGYLSGGPYNKLFLIIMIGILASALIVILYKLALSMKDKAKSGPFAKLLSRSSATAIDPATKARMDDLRTTFDKGVETFNKAGKDLYTLPWFLLVGPSGSGKTEALRHSNIGFPPGLQDPQQGAGGTLNMHWWLTNQAVVLDTAGRMFMQDSEAGLSEWKEFLKLLKLSRPNCPINGMLLVISAQDLLKHTAEKIDSTAGVIARQLDLIQRTLDVRFPVTVLVTKCDMIVGFREFFETLTDPIMKHQMLGWSNPSGLDDAFKPEMVVQHLADVRVKLMKRRMGLLQNPVHSQDPAARRTDEVDELFELPDNLMRIAPRLRSYLEKIFVAGEWSPKPLFLRGIYFTSSMRVGEALDMSLAQALGVEVESLPGGREWDKNSAYFLRDTFLSKVFREKGLVTRATNVNKALAKQKTTVLAVVGVSLLLFGGLVAWGFFSFRSTMEQPTQFWTAANNLIMRDLDGKQRETLVPLKMFEPTPLAPGQKAEGARYVGNRVLTDEGSPLFGKTIPSGLGKVHNRVVETPALVIAATGEQTNEIPVPMIARPVIGGLGGVRPLQIGAHREVVQRNVVAPLLAETRFRLENETTWNTPAVAALAEMLRLQTYKFGMVPSDAELTARAAGKPLNRAVVDVDVLFRYVLDDAGYKEYMASREVYTDKQIFTDAVAKAYPKGFSKELVPEDVLFKPSDHTAGVMAAVTRMKASYATEFEAKSELDLVQQITNNLTAIQEAEEKLWNQTYLKPGDTTTSGIPSTLDDYENGFVKKFEEAMVTIRAALVVLEQSLADQRLSGMYNGNPDAMFKKARKQREDDLNSQLALLIDQLPTPPAAVAEGKEKAISKEENTIKDLRDSLVDGKTKLAAALKDKLDDLQNRLTAVLPSLASSDVAGGDGRAFRMRIRMYELAERSITAAAAKGAGVRSAERSIKAAAAEGAGVQSASASFEDSMTAISGAFDETAKEIAEIQVKAVPGAISVDALKLPFEETKARCAERAASAARASKQAVLVSATKARYEGALARINDFPTSETVAAYVAERADRSLANIMPSPYRVRAVPFTAITAETVLESQFHPETVSNLLKDAYAIEALVVAPDSSGRAGLQILDQKSLAARIKSVNENLDHHVNRYGEYWTDMVVKATSPTIGDWETFSRAMRYFSPASVHDPLSKLYIIANNAVVMLPPKVKELAAIKGCEEAIKKRFGDARIANVDGIKELDKSWDATVVNWLALSQQTADKACVALKRDITRSGAKREKYFRPYTPNDGPAYWKGFVLGAVAALALADAGGGATERDWKLVAVEARKLPLARGGALVLSLAEVQALAEKAKNLGLGGGGDREDAKALPQVDPEIDRHLAVIAGGDLMQDAGRQKLLADIQSIAGSLTGGGVGIEFMAAPNAEWQAGKLGDLQYGLLVNGNDRKAIGLLNQENVVLEEQKKSRRFTLPTSGNVGIELSRNQAAVQGEKTVSLATAWPLLAEALAQAKESDGEGWMLVRLPLADGSGFLPLMVRWSGGALPKLNAWPINAANIPQ